MAPILAAARAEFRKLEQTLASCEVKLLYIPPGIWASRTRSLGGWGGLRRTGCLRRGRKFGQQPVGATSRWTPGLSGWFTHVIKDDQQAIMAV